MNQFHYVIRKTFKQINNKEINFGITGISDKELTLEPRFFPKEKNQIDCFQRKFLGFYVLRAAFRGLLLSVNYLAAGDNCLRDKLLGPSINSYYTAAYHILGTYLALNGRVVFDNQLIWRDKVLLNEKKFVIASFSKGNWHLNIKAWGHSGKWQELKGLKDVDYPESFKKLFRYWYKFRIKEQISDQEYFKRLVSNEPIGTPLDIADIVEEFLKKISETRHLALYSSFGSEPEVMSNLVNRDATTDSGIDFQARQYKEFAYSFLNENIKSLTTLLNFIRANKNTREWLQSSVFQPWYDIQAIDKLDNDFSKINLAQLNNWLTERRQKKI